MEANGGWILASCATWHALIELPKVIVYTDFRQHCHFGKVQTQRRMFS